jgi:3-deoxy-manno-octulosonate cytidylyltransferase (CMP-KDO synthetase)
LDIVAVIPARYASVRFPGKPLAMIMGKTMIEHVYQRVSACSQLNRIYVATDDIRIVRTVEAFGGSAILTSPDHPSGTDRVAEAAKRLGGDLILNVQGDEPLIEPEILSLALEPLMADLSIPMASLKTELRDPEEWSNPNVVKVVTDANGFALYFSRACIPFARDAGEGPAGRFKHIGLYAYRRETLLRLAQLPPSPLERTEKLEQLRALENGYRIAVPTTDHSPVGVDTPDDLARVLKMLERGSH